MSSGLGLLIVGVVNTFLMNPLWPSRGFAVFKFELGICRNCRRLLWDLSGELRWERKVEWKLLRSCSQCMRTLRNGVMVRRQAERTSTAGSIRDQLPISVESVM